MRFLISVILLVSCLILALDPNTVVGEESVFPGKFYVIGLGPAGPEHATLKAIDCLKKADVIFCSDNMSERFSTYLKGKTLLGNPWRGNFKYKWKNLEKLGPKEKKNLPGRKDQVLE